MPKIKVGSLSDFSPDKLKAVTVEGKEILISNINGRLYAIDNVCTHDECELRQGELKGSLVTCPCHFARFDVTSGKVIEKPATGESIEPASVYEVKVEGQEVFIILK